jgi:Tfp pilus assembly protein PilF
MDRMTKLKQYLEAAPDDSFLQHALALEYIKIGNDPEAKNLLNQILKRDSDYIGSYYHLGKLLERIGEPGNAIEIYKNGMQVAKALNDRHSYNELNAAYQEAQDELEG